MCQCYCLANFLHCFYRKEPKHVYEHCPCLVVKTRDELIEFKDIRKLLA